MEHDAAHILVVDDEAAIRLTLNQLLRRRGYQVATAASGEAALSLIEQQSFDLLLLDLMMPGCSGIDVAQRARTLLPHATILFLTGSSPAVNAPQPIDLNVFDYMLKTADPQEVLERVAVMLTKQQHT